MPQYPRAVNYRRAPRRGSLVPTVSRVCYRFVTAWCLDGVATPSLIYFQGSVERSTKLRLAGPPCVSRSKRLMITLTAGGELVARQAQQPRWGTWRPDAGGGTVLWPPPGRPGPGVMTDLVFAPGQRIKCGRAIASQRSGAHTDHHVVLLQTLADVVLLQTPAAEKAADTGVELSAEASREVGRFRSAIRPPAAENAPAKVDLARIQAERDTSQRGPERINRHEPIKKPRRRRISRSTSPLPRGVTTPDLPEGI
jgi:hypothetical protein